MGRSKMGVDVFEDDGRFRQRDASCLVTKDGEFSEWPELQELGAAGIVLEVDDTLSKRDIELVEADEDLLAEPTGDENGE